VIEGFLHFLLKIGFTLAFGDCLSVLLQVDTAIEDLAVNEHLGESHAVLCERSGLVRANARRRSEGLNGLEILDKHVLLGHALGSQGERDSHSGEETFGHVGDNDTDGEHKVGNSTVPISPSKDEESNSERDSHN